MGKQRPPKLQERLGKAKKMGDNGGKEEAMTWAKPDRRNLESLLEKNFDGSHPYDRLTVIYRKLKRKDDVIRVLERAVYLFENIIYKERADRLTKLKKYQEKLGKAKHL